MAPHELADDQSGRDAKDEPDGRERRRLPRDGGPNLTAVEAERLEHGEFATATPDARHEGMPHCKQREHGEEHGQAARQPVDLAQAVDLDRDRGTERTFNGGDRRHSTLNGGEVGVGRDTRDEIWGAAGGVCGTHHVGETTAGERCAVREWLGVVEPGEHGAPDDPVVVAPVRAVAVNRLTDPLAQLTEARGPEGDLVGTVGGSAGDDLGAEPAPQRHESPCDNGAAVELHVGRFDAPRRLEPLLVRHLGVRARVVNGRREVPVPAVIRRSDYKVIEARRERQDGHHAEDAECGAEDG